MFFLPIIFFFPQITRILQIFFYIIFLWLFVKFVGKIKVLFFSRMFFLQQITRILQIFFLHYFFVVISEICGQN